MKTNMNIVEFGRALSGIIFYEQNNHREKIAHLKKMKLNVDSIISDRNEKSKN
jgi:hypothetical protein